MNSVRPWTIPRTMAWRRGMGEIVRAYEIPRRCAGCAGQNGRTVLAAREGDAGDQEGHATRPARLPLAIGTDVGSVEQELLQRTGQRDLLARLCTTAAPPPDAPPPPEATPPA